VVLTAALVALHVPGESGPTIVIPASLGMLAGGLWLYRKQGAPAYEAS